MLYTMFQGHQPFGSGERDLQVFTIYGCGSHLGPVTMTEASEEMFWKSELMDDGQRLAIL